MPAARKTAASPSRNAPPTGPCHRIDLGAFEPLLGAEEERQLARAIAGGDALARDRMIRANLRLVVTIARQYAGRGTDFDDLVGEGNLGLVHAAEHFDPDRGVRFSTYAAHWIRESIGRALVNRGGAIRLPSHVTRLVQKWERARRDLAVGTGSSPSDEEIAAALGLTESRVEMVRRARLARLAGAAGGTSPVGKGDKIESIPGHASPCDEAEAADERDRLYGRLARLEERERRAIELTFGLGGREPMRLSDAGAALGMTRQGARKAQLRGLRKLARA